MVIKVVFKLAGRNEPFVNFTSNRLAVSGGDYMLYYIYRRDLLRLKRALQQYRLYFVDINEYNIYDSDSKNFEIRQEV